MGLTPLFSPTRHGDGGMGKALDSLSRREMAAMVGIVLTIFAVLLLIGVLTR